MGWPRRKLLVAGAAVTAVVGGAFLLRALSELLAGHGTDTYRNAKGALMNYAGAVVTGVIFLLCMVIAFGVAWWHRRQERKYEEIVKARAEAANKDS